MNRIITLDGKKLLERASVIKDEKSNNSKYTFDCDLTNGSVTRRLLVRSIDEHGDSALLHQLDILIDEKHEKNEDSIYTQLLFVDFDDLNLGNLSQESIDELNKSEKTKPSSKLKKDYSRLIGLKSLMSDEGNLVLSFNGEDKYCYCPFDKSNSMSRECRISFIRKDYRDEMNKRLLLDIDFTRISLNLSKFFSYRGLYLSTGYRIDEKEGSLLSAETVIVVNDLEIRKKDRVYTATKDKNDNKWKFGIKDNKEIKINCFDGEGLISPEYAEMINRTLREDHGIYRKSTSFQIRMPFVKGMLHAVDFRLFLKDELGVDCSSPDSVYVEDIFGAKRDISKAGIILTKSMFKMADWLEDWLKKDINTIERSKLMEYYFEKVQQYDHAMYVTGMDSRLKNPGMVPMNFQFLCTLDLKKDDMKEIVGEYLDRIKPNEIEKEFTDQGNHILALGEGSCVMPDEYFESDDEPDNDEELSEDADNEEYNEYDENYSGGNRSVSVWDKYHAVYAMNRAFLNDSNVKKQVKFDAYNYIKKIAKGGLTVEGRQGYLSGDLLSLLLHIGKKAECKKIDKSRFDKRIEELEREKLKPYEFFMAGEQIDDVKSTRKFGLLRNPHLSRNEQCVLYSSVKKGTIYDKYFSDLTGVIITPFKSLVPMALGGADFDGDLVKVIKDYRIVTAIVNGVYKNGKKSLERKDELPVIYIPGTGSIDAKPTNYTIPFSVLLDTFSSKVGRISNLALEYAVRQYVSDADGQANSKENKVDSNPEGIDYCSMCTIVTGLEIDAAKTGEHPRENIKDLNKKMYEIRNNAKNGLFLSFKEAMKKDKKDSHTYGFSYEMEEIKSLGNKEGKGDDARYYNLKKGKKSIYYRIPAYKWEDKGVANIDRLPYICANAIVQLREEIDAIRLGEVEKNCFPFEDDEDWENKLDDEKKEKVEKLVEAYALIKSTEYKRDRFRKNSQKRNMVPGIINNIVTSQYGSFSTKLSPDLTAEEAINQAYIEIVEATGGVEETESALEKLKEKKWHYISDPLYAEGVLSGIINGNLTPDTNKMLTEFRKDGFMLLFYLLDYARSEFAESISIDEYIQLSSKENEKSDDDSSKNNEESDDDSSVKKKKKRNNWSELMNSNDYFRELNTMYIYNDDNGMSKKIINDEMVECCRQKLKEIFSKSDNFIDESIKYVWSVRKKKDRSNRFFWNIYSISEIKYAVDARISSEDVKHIKDKRDMGTEIGQEDPENTVISESENGICLMN